jgi:hypothetical protein
MRTGKLSRRDILEGAGTLVATLFASPIRAAAPEPTAITPQLIEAARREGTVGYYTSMELQSAERGRPTRSDERRPRGSTPLQAVSGSGRCRCAGPPRPLLRVGQRRSDEGRPTGTPPGA